MKKKNMKKLFCTALLAASLAGCTAAAQTTENTDTSLNIQEITDGSQDTQSTATPETGKQNGGHASQNTAAASTQTLITDGSSLFTDRDNAQTADLSEAETYTVKDGENITITKAGVYVIKGEAKNVTIRIETEDEDKVQIVLDGVTITNDSTPVIYVVNADKVFVTTTDSENKLSVTGTFTKDGDTNTDAVIFSKDDLVLNGTGTLTISSTNNGISSHDDLKITGGTYVITSTEDSIEANDSIAISAGTFNITSSKDAIHCENDEDDTVGYIYISGGSFTINAKDDAVQGTSFSQIDGGTFDITAAEGIEGTYVQINDGTITINASDDGINASDKSSAYTPVIEITGGKVTVKMGAGDTDALDANGSIYISGGTIDITAQSAFDYDQQGVMTGGTVTVNGQQVTTLTNSMMGGHGGGMQWGGKGNGTGGSGQMPSAPDQNGQGQMPSGQGGHGGHKRP